MKIIKHLNEMQKILPRKCKQYCCLFLMLILYNGEIKATDGALAGEFSVSSTLKVHFAKGNLQYQASTKTWRFAANQYTFIGTSNSNISSSYSGWIDLFGWGTSGVNQKPYETSQSYHDYPGPGNSLYASINGTDYDWGRYNKISNGGNHTGRWRTLTYNEWYYMLNSRTNASNKRGFARVNGVPGFVLLPDNWTLPSGSQFTPGNNPVNWTTNTYTTAQWAPMEQAGAVFFPISGVRNGTAVTNTSSGSGVGHYWTSTAKDGHHLCVYHFSFFAREADGFYPRLILGEDNPAFIFLRRYEGAAVRLAQNSSVYNSTTYNLTVVSSNTSYGTVSGGGTYGEGTSVTIKATPKTGYQFSKWNDNNTNATRTVSVTGNTTYTATFEPISYTITWKQDDGTTIDQTNVEYGQTPTHSDPSKPATAEWTYSFAGWTPTIVAVTANATYTAKYDSVPNCLPIASGTCGASGDNLTWVLTCDSVLTISGNGMMKNYYITNSTLAPWYDFRNAILSVVISDNVTSVGNFAFSQCEVLKTIEIPNSVTIIGEYAFNKCIMLAQISIPGNVTSIGIQAFYKCSALKNIIIPNSVITLGPSTFEQCTSLTSVTISNNLSVIENSTFANCTSLTQVTIPNKVSSIENSAFFNCTGLVSIDFPNTVHSIGEYAFSQCSALTSITLPDSVASIGESAFFDCGALTSVEIPNSVISIGDYAFYVCSGLASITIDAEAPPSLGSGAFDDTNDCPIYVPCGSLDAYKSTWSIYTLRIQGNTKYIITTESDDDNQGSATVEQ